MVLKLLSSFVSFLLLANTCWADLSKIRFNGKVRYFSTLVDDLGSNINSARPGTVFDLHFSYPLNEKLTIKSINFLHDVEDSNSGDKTYNIRFNQRLALFYKYDNLYLAPYGKMINHDKNPKKQEGNAHFGLYTEYFFKKNISLSADYREETSNGSIVAGNRYGQDVLDLRYKHRNIFEINNWPVSFYTGYVEGNSLRGAHHIKLVTNVTNKFEVSTKYVRNIGKGPLFSNNIGQNRDFVVMEIGYKF